MSNPKLKSENYENMGGINRKISQYLTNKTEFLDLQNVDFKTVGALSSFPGYTQFLTGATSPITGIMDLGASGAARLDTLSGISNSLIATTANEACLIQGGTFQSIYDFVYHGNTVAFDFARGTNLYACNQSDLFRFDGFTSYQFSLPKPSSPFNNNATFGSTGGLSGNLVLTFAFVRNDGFYGPAVSHTYALTGCSGFISYLPMLNTFSQTFLTVGISLGSFGISGMQVWYALNGGTPKGISGIPFGVTTFSAAPATFAINDAFSSFLMSSIQPEDYFGAFCYGPGNYACGASLVNYAPGQLQFSYNAPSCAEIFSNQLFLAGFATTTPTGFIYATKGTQPQSQTSDLWYSQVGQFEKFDLTGFITVKKDDGDSITALKAYLTQLIIGKYRSLHVLSGTDPDNFVLTEATDQYGIINNRAVCVWRNRCWFLDRRGIAEYDGANTKIMSDKVEDYFNRMNLSAARINAALIHVKERNEVWCAIPIDGSATNNIIIVYDYLADEWTTRKNVSNISAIGLVNRGISKEEVFFGTPSGAVFNFGQSFFTDNGVGYTSLVKTRFIGDMGHSVEKQFRRLYLDATVPSGTTMNLLINFYRNQGTTPYSSATMTISDFQKRMELGIPAKDLAIEFIYTEGSFLRLNGFTLEYRFQRAV